VDTSGARSPTLSITVARNVEGHVTISDLIRGLRRRPCAARANVGGLMDELETQSEGLLRNGLVTSVQVQRPSAMES
jgi:hypothetical protein